MPHMLAETCSNVINTRKYRASAHQGNWKPQCNGDFQEFLPDRVEQVEMDYVVHTKQTAMQLPSHSWKTKKLCSQETEDVSLLKSGTTQWWSSFQCVIFCIVQMHKRSMKQLTLLLYSSPSRSKAFMTTDTHILPRGKKWIWCGKKFHIRLHSLVCIYFLIKT